MRGISIQHFIKIGSKLKKLHGSKVFEKGEKYENIRKNGCFFVITFLFGIDYYRIKYIKNSACEKAVFIGYFPGFLRGNNQ